MPEIYLPGRLRRFRRRSDGVIVTVHDECVREYVTEVLLRREDTGRSWWCTPSGLRRKYKEIEEGQG